MDFVAGCFGGAAGCVASHPLDTIKVRMQCSQVQGYRTVDCARHIIRNESISALYKGLTPPLTTVAAITSVMFGTYGYILRQTHEPQCVKSHFIAGAGAGLVVSPMFCPMELSKCKLQMQCSKSSGYWMMRFRGPLDVLRTVYRCEGYTGLNRGMIGTLAREVPAIATYFATYHYLQQCYKQHMMVEYCPVSYLFISGGIAGSLSWACVYPFDVIKSRIQCDGVYDPYRKRFNYKYSGYSDCIREAVKINGYSVFYRGIGSTMMRAFPNNGVSLVVVSMCHSLYDKRRSCCQVPRSQYNLTTVQELESGF